MQRFRWAAVAAVGLTAATSVMAGVTAPGDRSGVAVRTPRAPSAAARATATLAAAAGGHGRVAAGRAANTAARPAAWWRTRIAVVNRANRRQVAPSRLTLSCPTTTRPRGNYVTGLRRRYWNRRQGSARGVGTSTRRPARDSREWP
jgi:hypothetical protein